MRPLARLAAAGLATALLAANAACGAANVLVGLSPKQIVTLASGKVTGQSYRMSIDGTVGLDTSGVSGVPAAALQQLTGGLRDFRIAGSGDVQDGQRERLALTLTLPTHGDQKIVVVGYDGHFYLSADGGRTFADMGTLNFDGVATTPNDVKTLLDGATGVTDLGTTVHDGERVEHLRANLGQDYFTDALSKARGTGAMASQIQNVGILFAQAITVAESSLDLYVRTLDGRVEATDMHARLSLDMAKMISLLTTQLGGMIPSGSAAGQVGGAMVMTYSASDRFTDYGARITVSKPTVSA